MARFFIDRPIFAWVIALVIMLVGALFVTAITAFVARSLVAGSSTPVAEAVAPAAPVPTGPEVLVATRALLRGAHTHSLDEQLDLERDVQSRLGFTHDYIEGVTAFLQKRPAQFKGE